MNGLAFTSSLALAAINQIIAFYISGKRGVTEATLATTLGVVALQGFVTGFVTPPEFTKEAIIITVVMLYAKPLGKWIASVVDKHRLRKSAKRARDYGREIGTNGLSGEGLGKRQHRKD